MKIGLVGKFFGAFRYGPIVKAHTLRIQHNSHDLTENCPIEAHSVLYPIP